MSELAAALTVGIPAAVAVFALGWWGGRRQLWTQILIARQRHRALGRQGAPLPTGGWLWPGSGARAAGAVHEDTVTATPTG